MLVKTLRLPTRKLVYAAFTLHVPEMVIKRVQEKLTKFLWKNKNYKIKRSVIYQSLSSGGLNFLTFAQWLNLYA